MTQQGARTGDGLEALRLEAIAREMADLIHYEVRMGGPEGPWVDHLRAIILTAILNAVALSRLQPFEPGTWRPIESAPKMRKIIVSYENELGKRRCVMACYYKAHSLEMHDDYAEVGEYNEATGQSFAPEGWYEEHDSDNPIMTLQGEPDFWMPLPAPPTQETRS
jgi:hypothetical protein